VLRFWALALGPGTVADLLRLMTADRRGRLGRPLHLAQLARAGLVCFANGRLLGARHRPAALA
jgi:hypothetical protein